MPSATGVVVVAASECTDDAPPLAEKGATCDAEPGRTTPPGGVTNKVLQRGHFKALGDADAPQREHDFIGPSSTPRQPR